MLAAECSGLHPPLPYPMDLHLHTHMRAQASSSGLGRSSSGSLSLGFSLLLPSRPSAVWVLDSAKESSCCGRRKRSCRRTCISRTFSGWKTELIEDRWVCGAGPLGAGSSSHGPEDYGTLDTLAQLSSGAMSSGLAGMHVGPPAECQPCQVVSLRFCNASA